MPLVGLIAAVCLAKPRSLWARWFYGEAKLARARARYDDPTSRLVRLHRRLDDLIGGAPTFGDMAPLRMEVVAGRLSIRGE